jgi:transcription antitermination protein NusB
VSDRPMDPNDINPPAPPAAPSPAKSGKSAKTGKAAHGPHRKPAAKSSRRRSRELALQGLYQWLVSGEDAALVDAHIREIEDFGKSDTAHFDALLHGCIAEAAGLDAVLKRHVDRRTELLSPVEHAVLLIGAYELTHCIEVPYRVVINEAVEVAKSFGGTDGHKYVNGVLDKAAADLRPTEVSAARAARNSSGT